ncbi:uncharacterized protein LMH87_008837 [Akanthomyces muscarius]|uniref:Uncharacterized protein n=1 Tax=Akanthomyces muscarius TaxID=2231603 RepID=A0A9W8QK08_AKAMU|nr:uncharacterized protein LMH87_008837 [Akanthomyces muscarius]KAJ4158305.1 hypothetical protein LMH87_008837 [Akanthomyces muscarius]
MMPQSTSHSYSLSTTLLLVLVLTLGLFPNLFHSIWTLPLSLLPFARTRTGTEGASILSWTQKEFKLPAQARGSYLITDEVLRSVPEIRKYKSGLLSLFIKHTSCALSLNENFDKDVRTDMSNALDRIVPAADTKDESLYKHNAEGSDDMPAHIKSALVGASVTIPIKDGKLQTGQWQGIWFLEFRASKHERDVIATIQGEKA